MTQEEFFKRFTYSVSTDRIGGGGFGTVYKAKDHVLHRTVAIKVSEVKTTADGQKTFSLKDEFEALQHVPKHPNIANYEELYTFEDHRGICDYAVMQYYPDGNLSNAIKQGLTAQQKEDIAIQLLEGIAFLHKNKVVHRDLKPGNILVMKDDDGIIPIITDFGLSKAANIGDASMFSNSFGGGTQRYSSPEQLQGKPLRLNTDLWSYGTILYELFTGEQLFSAGSGAANSAQADLEIYNKIIHGDVEKLSKMPEKWRKVAERCLVVDADKRAKDEEELFGIINGEAQKEVVLANETVTDVRIKRSQAPIEDEGTVVVRTNKPTERQPEPEKQDHHKSRKGLWIILGIAVAVAIILLFALPKNEPLSDLIINVNDVSFVMKPVEGGTFQMGATTEEDSIVSMDGFSNDNAKPVHSVTVSSFYMAETEVTQALWKEVMGMEQNYCYYANDSIAVEQVSYNDIANKFIPRLNQLTGRNFRLPTEAEWEFAARGGNKTHGYMYAGSNNIDDVAWYTSHFTQTVRKEPTSYQVKTKQPNELGLYDMSGNVWEWCQDWYGEYGSNPQTNPKGPSNGSRRVLRGGGWIHPENSCVVSVRNYDCADSRQLSYGFRLALSVETNSDDLLNSQDTVNTVIEDLPELQPSVWNLSLQIGMGSEQPVPPSPQPFQDYYYGSVNDHEWVDLGLPSGTLWATCNVGATKPEEYGDHFAWSETSLKNNPTIYLFTAVFLLSSRNIYYIYMLI